jgi:tetratricopeptide (TPR) repeat protein
MKFLPTGSFISRHFYRKRSCFRAVMVFLFFLAETGAVAQTFRVEGGAGASLLRLFGGGAYPENESPAPGGEVGLSFFFNDIFPLGDMFGLSALGIFSVPLRDDAPPSFQIQAFAGPSFRLHRGNLAVSLTPSFYFFILINDIQPAFDYGVGANLAVEYHFNQKLYIYGKLNEAYGMAGANLTFTPILGMGFKVNDHTQYTRNAAQPLPVEQPTPLLAEQPKEAAPAEQPVKQAEPVLAEQPKEAAPAEQPAKQAEPVLAEQPKETAPAQTPPSSEPTLTAREYSAQGYDAYKAKDWDGAIAAYSKALELEPDSVTRKKNLALAYNARGLGSYNDKNLNAAISDLTEALKLEPENAAAKRTLERAQAEKPAAAASAPAATTPASAARTPAPASTTPASAARTPAPATTTPASAARTPAPATTTPAPAATTPAAQAAGPNLTAREYGIRGYAAYSAKDWDGAIAAYSKALELEPNNVTRKKNLAVAYNARGLAAYNAKNWDAAIADLTEALKLDPDNVAAKRDLEWAKAGKEGEK